MVQIFGIDYYYYSEYNYCYDVDGDGGDDDVDGVDYEKVDLIIVVNFVDVQIVVFHDVIVLNFHLQFFSFEYHIHEFLQY